jgi:hypothetical protein
VLQARRPVAHFGFHRGGDRDETLDGVAWLVAVPDRRVLLAATSAEASGCVDARHAVALGHQSRRDWLLLEARAVLPACLEGLAGRPASVVRAPVP